MCVVGVYGAVVLRRSRSWAGGRGKSSSPAVSRSRGASAPTTAADGGPNDVPLHTRLCRHGDSYIELHAPFLSAAMQAVTGAEMAIAVAQLGGIGILPVSQTIVEQCGKIDDVKRFKAALIYEY